MKSTMAESLGQMKDTIDQLVIEEGPSGENDEQLQIAAKPDELSTEQSDKNQQSESAESNNGAKKPTSGEPTEQSINTLINQSSVPQQDARDKIELLGNLSTRRSWCHGRQPEVFLQLDNHCACQDVLELPSRTSKREFSG